MKITYRCFWAIIALTLLSGCVAEMTKTLEDVNAALAKPLTKSPSLNSKHLARITPEQVAKVDSSLTVKIDDSRISTAINEGAVPVLGADAVSQTFFVNKIGSSKIIDTALEAGISPIIVAGTEKACTEKTYGLRPNSDLFERIVYKKYRIIIGSSTYRMPRDRKRLNKFLES